MAGKKVVRYAVEELELLCEWEDCNVKESVMEIYLSHLKTNHLCTLTESDRQCRWKDCETIIENLAELRRHVLLHAFHNKIKCHGKNLQLRKKLPDCTLSMNNRNIIPELPEPLVCYWENCLDEFECAETFYRHVDYHVECNCRKDNGKRAVCLWDECKRNFIDHHKVKDHVRSHTQEKLVACPTCGGMFSSRTKFLDHVQRQQTINDDDPEGVYVCEYCCRRMNSERLLRDHMRHHVNHYKCPYCDMTCPTPSGVQVHINYRHSENKPHSCEYCDYKCKTQSDLRKHLETHSSVPLYDCPFTGCTYASRSQTCLNTHFRKMHKGSSTKYSCHLCNKVCTRGNYLTKHLLSFHKFRWPSGHCRFRYHLHEDGYYRLQTVRYESIELSEAMMCNNEDVDNPSTTDNPSNFTEGKDETISPISVSDQDIIQDATQNNSFLLYVQNGNNEQFEQGSMVVSNSLSGGYVQDENTEQENPVLIQIVDTNNGSLPSDDAMLFLELSEQLEKQDSLLQFDGSSIIS